MQAGCRVSWADICLCRDIDSFTWHTRRESTTGTAVCFSSDKVHAIGINCISIAADGASMLTSSIDGAVALWDTSALKPAMARMRIDGAQRGASSSTEQEEESRHAGARNAKEPLIILEQAKVLHTEGGLKKRGNEDGLNAQREDTLPREVVSFCAHLFMSSFVRQPS